jgi:hypothetical protein
VDNLDHAIGLDDHFFEQMALYLDGRLDPGDFARFQQELAADPAKRQLFVEICLQATLLTESGFPFATDTVPSACADQLQESPLPRGSQMGGRQRSPVLGFLNRMMHVGGESPVATALTWIVMAILVSGTALTAVFIGMMVFGGKPPVGKQEVAGSGERRAISPVPNSVPAVANTTPVARLTRVVDCNWESKGAAPNIGDDFAPGRKLALKSGLAEIIFQGGARTLLEGPATLEIRSCMGVYLQQGKFTVTVENPLARGFEVLAPGMKYTDLGTEFGVAVAANGEQEVHVFRGNVRAEEVTDESSGTGDAEPAPAPQGVQSVTGSDDSHPPSPSSHKAPAVLSANQGLHVAAPDPSGNRAKQVERIAANEKQFVRSLRGPFPLFSTGVDLDRGADDPHWEIIAISTDPKFTPRHAVAAVPAKSYLPDARDKAQWIADAKTPSTMQKGCRWTLRTRFDLSGFDPATASIEGKVAVDNYLIEMRLNGKKVPLPSVRASEWFARGVPIKVDSGFTSGANTLEIVIENADSGEEYNPMGICLDWRGTATRTTKPNAAGATSNEHR